MKLPSLSSEAAFEHVIHPQITSFEPNYGSTKGQTLYINGNNFSPSKDKITVSVDGVNCVISSSTSNYI